MESSRLMYGSVGAGIVAGILVLVLFGWVPYYGWILAGVVAGLASRGSGRGLLSGLLAGIIVSAVVIALTLFVPISALNTIFSDFGNQNLNNTVFSTVYTAISMGTVELVKKIAVDLIVLPAIGGFIGGSILSNGYTVVEVEHESEHVESRKTARIVDDDNEEVSS